MSQKHPIEEMLDRLAARGELPPELAKLREESKRREAEASETKGD